MFYNMYNQTKPATHDPATGRKYYIRKKRVKVPAPWKKIDTVDKRSIFDGKDESTVIRKFNRQLPESEPEDIDYDPERPDRICQPLPFGYMGHRAFSDSDSDTESCSTDPELTANGYANMWTILNKRKKDWVRTASCKNVTKLDWKANGSLWAKCHLRGQRDTMEDDFKCTIINHYNCYAVYDGHAGPRAAQMSAKILFNIFKYVIQTNTNMAKDVTDEKMEQCLLETFQKNDDRLYIDLQYMDANDGTTATIVIHDTAQNKLHFANLGDSRSAILVDDKYAFHTIDHKPTDEKEKKRIEAAGGHVKDGRVNGDLALSRAFGDFSLKDREFKGINQFNKSTRGDYLSNIPDVTTINLEDDIYKNGQHVTVLLACDGVWDVYLESKKQKVDEEEIEVNEIEDLLIPTINSVLYPEAKFYEDDEKKSNKFKELVESAAKQRQEDRDANLEMIKRIPNSKHKKWPYLREDFDDEVNKNNQIWSENDIENRFRECAKTICQSAYEKKSRDNITCVVFRIK